MLYKSPHTEISIHPAQFSIYRAFLKKPARLKKLEFFVNSGVSTVLKDKNRYIHTILMYCNYKTNCICLTIFEILWKIPLPPLLPISFSLDVWSAWSGLSSRDVASLESGWEVSWELGEREASTCVMSWEPHESPSTPYTLLLLQWVVWAWATCLGQIIIKLLSVV